MRTPVYIHARKKKSIVDFIHAYHAIHNAKCNYIMGQLEKHKNDQKKFWASVKNVMPSI